MSLQRLEVHQFRNLSSLEINLNTGLQVIYGENASGKTSVLEAIHVLCSGKSFLGASPRKMQQFKKTAFLLAGEVKQADFAKQPLAFRWEDNHIHLKVGFASVKRASDYALIQPVQAVSPLSYRLIDDTPDIRRRFMDWGVFHVKHGYSQVWRQFQRTLGQRNAMLSSGTDRRTLSAWDNEYVKLSEELDRNRNTYVDQLTEALNSITQRLFPDQPIRINYQPGWDRKRGLSGQLEESFSRDMGRKFTYFGPQRADLSIRLGQQSAKDTASRGQKKLITFALYLAQATLQQQIGHREGLLLIDDLPSELDAQHQHMVLGMLKDLPMQVILSCIDINQLGRIDGEINKMFHVKQGRISEVV